jgi:hypothetical protein
MKKKIFYPVVIMFILIISMVSCKKDDNTYSYEAMVPVYMDFKAFRQPPKVKSARNIQQAGKIYFKDNYIFINEVNEGIHIIDNTNPSYPKKVNFYEITGNVDMAIRGNMLFVDSYIDLIAMDISDIHNPVEVSRIENAFPEVLPLPVDFNLPYAWDRIDRSKGVIVGWEVETLTAEYPDYWGGGWPWWRFGATVDFAMEGGGNAAGIAGSMARFMLNEHYLHSIAQPFVLKTIDVSDAGNMLQTDSISSWREMETLFRYNGNLFVGTTTGMVIYSLANPSHPQFVSELDHINACDPVVVENDIAYVTLRAGTSCMNTTNQLDVIDISDIESPTLLKSYPMFNPHGLGIDNGTLFICDGADGLKVYDATNPLAIQSNMIAHFPGIDTYDVIPLGDILLLIGHDGLFQYDYSDPQNIQLLSHIEVGND